MLDGAACALLKNAATVSVGLPAGRHRLVVTNGHKQSNEIVFEADERGEFGVRASPPASRINRYGLLRRFTPVIHWERRSSKARVITDG